MPGCGSRFRSGKVRSIGFGLSAPGGAGAGAGEGGMLFLASFPLGFFTGGWLLLSA